jgi:hypothetical protein
MIVTSFKLDHAMRLEAQAPPNMPILYASFRSHDMMPGVAADQKRGWDVSLGLIYTHSSSVHEF